MSKPLAIRLDLEPDGFPGWLSRVEADKVARKAVKKTGALLLGGPAEATASVLLTGPAPALLTGLEAEASHESTTEGSLAQKRPRRHCSLCSHGACVCVYAVYVSGGTCIY